MDVLMITQDANLLREGSSALEDMKTFATIANRLVVVVMNKGRKRADVLKVSDKLWIIPTNVFFSFLAPFAALHIAKRELFFQGRLQVDLVAGQDAGLAGLTAWITARLYGRPLHLYIRYDVFSRPYVRHSIRNRLRSLGARFLAERARTLCVGSEAIHTALADIDVALADDATVIPYNLDVYAIQQEPIRADLSAKYPQFKFIMLVVAPLTESQNVQLAIKILAEVHRQYRHVGLVIVGEGPQRRKIESLARKEGVAEKVVFERWTPNISSYYKTARVCLFTAFDENDGDTLQQAAAASCAILTSDTSVASEIVQDGISGFICDPNDATSYAQKIMMLLHDSGLREKIRMGGMQAIAHYSDNINDPSRRMQLYKLSWERAVTK